MRIDFLNSYAYRVAEERSNALAKVNAEFEETISKLKSQASIKPIQDFPVAEPAGKRFDSRWT